MLPLQNLIQMYYAHWRQQEKLHVVVGEPDRVKGSILF